MKPYQNTAAGLIGLILTQFNVGAAVVSLGSASSYAVLGASTVTNTGNTVLTGDLGLSPGTSVTGFFGTTANEGPGVVTGDINIANTAASQAQVDAEQAYDDLGLLTVDVNVPGGVLAGTLTAGVYKFDTSADLTGTLTLSGPGDFVFLIGTTLTTGSSSVVSLIGGADAADVFFRVGSSADLGTDSMFVGTIIADQSISATDGADVTGRLLALNAAVTLINNQVTVPEPTSAISLLMGMGLLLKRRRA